MNIQIKARYVFEVSSDEMGYILKGLEKIGTKGEILKEEILAHQRPQLEALITKFQIHINAITKDIGNE